MRAWPLGYTKQDYFKHREKSEGRICNTERERESGVKERKKEQQLWTSQGQWEQHQPI